MRNSVHISYKLKSYFEKKIVIILNYIKSRSQTKFETKSNTDSNLLNPQKIIMFLQKYNKIHNKHAVKSKNITFIFKILSLHTG